LFCFVFLCLLLPFESKQRICKSELKSTARNTIKAPNVNKQRTCNYETT
jgi:hypothetical protein